MRAKDVANIMLAVSAFLGIIALLWLLLILVSGMIEYSDACHAQGGKVIRGMECAKVIDVK